MKKKTGSVRTNDGDPPSIRREELIEHMFRSGRTPAYLFISRPPMKEERAEEPAAPAEKKESRSDPNAVTGLDTSGLQRKLIHNPRDVNSH